MKIEFVVPGTPVGKGRPRFAKRGNFVKTYTPEKTASYENLVKLAAQAAMRGAPPVADAVGCRMVLRVIPPASWSKKKREQALAGVIYPISKPDIDNVVKGIFDAMNEVVFLDDKQVVHLTLDKAYATEASATVEVWALQ